MAQFPTAFTILRTCYRHPAGKLGVALTAHLAQRGLIERADLVDWPMGGYRLTAVGATSLAHLGIDLEGVSTNRTYKGCADYTERLADGTRGVPHVGGALGAALTRWLLESGSAERLPEPTSVYEKRVLRLTAEGRAGLVNQNLVDERCLRVALGASA